MFPVIAKITRCHTFTKEINHARARSQYFNDNFYCKNCLRTFSAMTEKPALLCPGMLYNNLSSGVTLSVIAFVIQVNNHDFPLNEVNYGRFSVLNLLVVWPKL